MVIADDFFPTYLNAFNHRIFGHINIAIEIQYNVATLFKAIDQFLNVFSDFGIGGDVRFPFDRCLNEIQCASFI